MEAAAVQRPRLKMTRDELIEITGYTWPSKQLEALHARGFHRAELDRHKQVSLERAHYEAVCAGAMERARPKVRPPKISKR